MSRISFFFCFILFFYPCWISSQCYHDLPGVFHYFVLTPLEIHLFPSNFGISVKFWYKPLEFQRLLLYPLKFSINTLNRGLWIFFWKSPYFFWVGFYCVCVLLSTDGPKHVIKKTIRAFFNFTIYRFSWFGYHNSVHFWYPIHKNITTIEPSILLISWTLSFPCTLVEYLTMLIILYLL